MPVPDTSMPPGWEDDPNWDSDASIWATLRGPGDTKASSKKHKKRAHNSEHPSYGILAIHEKVTKEYLVQLLTVFIENETLAAELRSAHRAYALQEAEQASTMVILTPQCMELPLYPKYKGEGEPLPPTWGPTHTRDRVSARANRPLSSKKCRVVQYEMCSLEDISFKELHELTKATPPAERTREIVGE
jgi:hypothetical protein